MKIIKEFFYESARDHRLRIVQYDYSNGSGPGTEGNTKRGRKENHD
jgi:hypothetical protein